MKKFLLIQWVDDEGETMITKVREDFLEEWIENEKNDRGIKSYRIIGETN